MPTASEQQPAKLAAVRTSEPFRKRRHWPKTMEARMELGVRELRAPATFEEYLALSEDCNYRIHYRDGHVISFLEIDEQTNAIMGEASVIHELIVARMITLLSETLNKTGSGFQVLGSNVRLFIAEDRKGCNADVTVVEGPVEQKTYKFNRRAVTGVTNPWLLVEVLSDSTREFDLSDKLSDYKQLPSLQQVIFIEQEHVWASTYIRISPKEWRNLDLNSLEDQIPILDTSISLQKVYKSILNV
ncbi:MAG: Uma2 family endonuclease [Lewinellaceae bacterium]|nr:Uma2 family endonuclease [Phaeodactylibacter sp.]MCB9039595.1 Uma2 family endonuclease [Lewinellaceae bacterium]